MVFHGISWYFMVFHGISWYFTNIWEHDKQSNHWIEKKGYDKAVLLKIDSGFPQSRIFATALLIVSHDGSMYGIYYANMTGVY